MDGTLPHPFSAEENSHINGSFVEQPTDKHVLLRRSLLSQGVILPPPRSETINAQTTDFPGIMSDYLLHELSTNGLLVIQLNEPLSSDQYLALGSLLGTPIPETASEVMPYVERNVILNLVSEHGYTSDVSLQPFATTFLTLHTESSSKRAEEQPRYIVLMCCEPGDDATTAQTVLVPMAAVEQRLTPQEIAVLSQTSYRNNRSGPSIIRSSGGRRVFSFRDFYSQTLEWTHTNSTSTSDTVNSSIRSLLTSMYALDNAIGVHWKRGMCVIIDNTRFFHGKSAGHSYASSVLRHLKRLRIV